MGKFTMKQALEVAEIDCGEKGVGVSSAICRLGEMGFDTSYYWNTMDKYVNDVDEDNMNIKTRDELYRRLGISKLMEKAYEKVGR